MQLKNMSDLNIYLADAVKKRMSQFDCSWSEICYKAIEAELLRLEAEQEARIQANKSHNWEAKRLNPETFDDAVIQPCLKNNNCRNKVKMLSDLHDNLIRELENCYLSSLNCKLSNLIHEECQVKILFPGRDWQIGNLQLDFQLYFKYPLPLERSENL